MIAKFPTEVPNRAREVTVFRSTAAKRLGVPIVRVSAWGRASIQPASKCAIAVTVVVALCIPVLPLPSNGSEIPFESNRAFGLILVRVEVNGRPAVLIVDSGSSQTIISPELGDVPTRTLRENGLSGHKGSGLTGLGVFKTATLRVGPITWRDRRVIVMDMHELSKSMEQEIDGLLGMDFLREFGLVVVDSKNHKLILSP